MNYVKLTFGTDQNKTYTITIPNADAYLNGNDIKLAMDRIIQSGALVSASGRVTSKKSAESIKTTTTSVTV